jgi:hypothetical protein
MTQPNLDALAKLAPFYWDRYYDSDWIADKDETQVDNDAVIAALNEWAELRAYRERTEAALRGLSAELAKAIGVDESQVMLGGHGLWRDPKA